ncbi:MAG TPA: FecR domain-containing protein [Bacteroidales bacterium]
MKNLNPLNESIIELLIRKLKDQCTEDELQAIRNWLNESKENRCFYDELNDIWQATAPKDQILFNALDALKKVRLRTNIPSKKPINQGYDVRSNSFGGRMFLKIAAIFVLGLGIGMLLFHFISLPKQPDKENQLTEIVAPIGSKTQVFLPDGTRVWLNSGSKLSYSSQFNQKYREVTLEGEAYFDVAKRNGMLFFVKTPDITIRVLGTAFNVKAYPTEGSVETTLVRGSLIVEQHSEKGEVNRTKLEPSQRATFIKNEGVLYLSETEKQSLKSNHIRKVEEAKGQVLVSKKVDTDIFTAWKENKLVFRNETFESLSVKLERWYGVQINIADDEIKKYHFNGTIVNETVQDVLEMVKYALPIRYSILHNVITIQKK